ncbi:3189_t:CDS:1, partial [Cetraspora pellucida]
ALIPDISSESACNAKFSTQAEFRARREATRKQNEVECSEQIAT